MRLSSKIPTSSCCLLKDRFLLSLNLSPEQALLGAVGEVLVRGQETEVPGGSQCQEGAPTPLSPDPGHRVSASPPASLIPSVPSGVETRSVRGGERKRT